MSTALNDWLEEVGLLKYHAAFVGEEVQTLEDLRGLDDDAARETLHSELKNE